MALLSHRFFLNFVHSVHLPSLFVMCWEALGTDCW
ncbi:hypothetical protein HEB94_000384 [Actinopolymorpha pittospori]|uniref:Uncharacterized protein n=1 Tax=Actinopolymorpha pittospori TaxID=648752 RepID=A0A927MNK9_9ACTN|nr:hypothetical protein [Actinopolymorpha pittospori]